jgi:hypothetical protein
MPNINSVSGRAKFMDSDPIKLGYIIDFDMGVLDLAKTPQKYKEARKETINGIEATRHPITQA